uniref:Uncharacterized protein n=1 Tax=Anguilla anguilla TaxID=7936 RepID=A0A0E9RSL8_ANGAN
MHFTKIYVNFIVLQLSKSEIEAQPLAFSSRSREVQVARTSSQAK